MPQPFDAATRAVQAVMETLRSQGKELDPLLVQLDFALGAGAWGDVVGHLEHLAGMETLPRRVATVHVAIALVCRDALGDAARAVRHLDLALDQEPGDLEAFEALDQTLARAGDRGAKLLEASNRTMIERLRRADDANLEASLWRFLGEVFRARAKGAGKPDEDAATIRLASRGGPTSQEPHKILAELYMGTPSTPEKAVEEHQARIREDPSRVDSYKALRRLYFDARQYDRAWCLCATLRFLEQADQDEQQFHERYKGLSKAKARLDNERWLKDLFHADEDPFVGKIFETILPAVRRFKVQPHKAFGLKKKDKHDPATSTTAFAKTFAYAAHALNLPFLPELYLRPDEATGLQYATTDPPASVAGRLVLSGLAVQDLAFEVGRHLAYYRGEHYIRWLEPTIVGLRLLLLAAIKTAQPKLQTPPDPTGVLDMTVESLGRALTPMAHEQLALLVRKLVRSTDEADVEQWIRAVELTACRAGFLLCNDLGVASRMIQDQTSTLGDSPPKEKIRELVVFSVSEPYFRLREALGITIGQ
jgi:golgin subfamily B member 1